MSVAIAVAAHDLNYTHQNGTEALRNISINIEKGSRLLLIGANGAGKVRGT
jgi:cobalt/nickel transport system ATP-binding protein